jgi:hypothetical protein
MKYGRGRQARMSIELVILGYGAGTRPYVVSPLLIPDRRNSGEEAMKLDTNQVQYVAVVTGVDPVPETTVTHDHLRTHFGEDTFYLDSEGAYVWEPADDSEGSAPKLEAFQIASWANKERTQLLKEEPKLKGVQVQMN